MQEDKEALGLLEKCYGRIVVSPDDFQAHHEVISPSPIPPHSLGLPSPLRHKKAAKTNRGKGGWGDRGARRIGAANGTRRVCRGRGGSGVWMDEVGWGSSGRGGEGKGGGGDRAGEWVLKLRGGKAKGPQLHTSVQSPLR